MDHYPIDEHKGLNDLSQELFHACGRLDDLLDRYKRVYVHCDTSITRAPTVAIAYLCLYCRTSDWQRPAKVYNMMKREAYRMHPNMKAVCKMLKDNRQ